MPFIVAVLSIIICGFFVWVSCKLFENTDHFFPGIICFIFALCMVFGSVYAIINTVIYSDYLANAEAYNTQAIETRTAYVTMLDEVERLIKQDVTASDTYLEIYNNVINFNRQVNRANKWGGTLAEGIFCDPRYKGLETIPLN